MNIPPTYRPYNTSLKPQFKKNLTSLPHISYKDQTSEYASGKNFNSKVLDYADALSKARGLAQSAGIRCSSTPLASSIMKNVKVLARLDRDGLYYLGHVMEQVSNNPFTVSNKNISPISVVQTPFYIDIRGKGHISLMQRRL